MNQKPNPAILDYVDVLIVGAGMTGIGMAYHITKKHPGKSIAIFDSRDAIGGTWDLFRYPGIRSDTDLHTFGFEFKPWTSDNTIADADEILSYLNEVIDENGLRSRIHLGNKVIRADFSSSEGRWHVTLERTTDSLQFEVTCRWLVSGAGYYDHENGYAPEFEGKADFAGDIVHPQHWPADLDYSGKKVVVIGSGATAVTILPALSEKVAHVTMLQRSPGYVLPAPRQDPIANTLRKVLPERAAYVTTRKININKQILLYNASKRFPGQMRKLIRKVNVSALPDGYEVDTHFNPKYGPWDQRMCVVPDSDMFKAIADGAASVVTDTIVRFTEAGIALASGKQLDADIIVTATGLNMVPFGKIELQVDGVKVDLNDQLMYKSIMVSGVPNFVFVVGYANHAWTLKVDLVADHFCRMLGYMESNGLDVATPVVDDPTLTTRPYIEMGSGYVSRAMHLFPKKGSHGPWTADQDYRKDRVRLGKAPIDDPALRFASVAGSETAAGGNAQVASATVV